jgi:hypothetical protein
MAEAARIVIHWLLGLAGFVLCYSAVFLHKDEEGKLENIIQKWWQKVRGLQTGTTSREAAFMRTVSDLSFKGFAVFFGDSLFRFRAILASCCLSLGSISFYAYIKDGLRSNSIYAKMFTIVGLILLLLCILRLFINRSLTSKVWTALTTLAVLNCLVTFALSLHEDMSEGSSITITLTSLICGLVSNVAFIALTRWILRKASCHQSLFMICIMLFGNLLLGATLLLIPYSIFFFTVKASGYYIIIASLICLIAYSSNILDAIVSSIFLVIALLMIVHRLFWPLLERPMYAFNRYKILSEQKKMVFFAGIACVGFAWPKSGEAIKAFIESIVK